MNLSAAEQELVLKVLPYTDPWVLPQLQNYRAYSAQKFEKNNPRCSLQCYKTEHLQRALDVWREADGMVQKKKSERGDSDSEPSGSEFFFHRRSERPSLVLVPVRGAEARFSRAESAVLGDIGQEVDADEKIRLQVLKVY